MEGNTKKKEKSALGRGLSSLISSQSMPEIFAASRAIEEKIVPIKTKPEPQEEIQQNAPNYLNIKQIINSSDQPRKEFSDSELQTLADSIKKVGILQPLLVRPSKKDVDLYEIVAGERRWRAAKIVGLEKIPVVVQDLADRDSLEIAIIENIQRQDLNPVEEGRAYQKLIDDFNLSQEEVAVKVSKDRTTVANLVRLLKLPDEVLNLISEKKLSTGHAKIILAIKDSSAQASLAKKVVAEHLSVRELEALVSRVVVLDAGKTALVDKSQDIPDRSDANGNFAVVVDKLRRALGTKVRIKQFKGESGKIEIDYFSEAELERVVDYICRQ